MQENSRERSSDKLENINYYSIILDVLHNWWVILIGAAAVAMLANMYGKEQYNTTYTTSATFVVSSKDAYSNVYSNLSSAQNLASTFSNILNSRIMEKKVCEDLGLDRLDATASASVIDETNLLVLQVTASTPELAYRIIRSIMNNYTTVSSAVLGNSMMEVLQEPDVPMSPDTFLDVRTSTKKAFLYAGLVFILIFAGLSYLNDTVKSEKELAAKLDAKALGAIYFEKKYKSVLSRIKHKKTSVLVTNATSSFQFVETYKKIAAKLTYIAAEKSSKTIVVTSVVENEGKSTVAANLALTLAKNPAKVLLVDCDLRRPSQYLIFDKNVPKGKSFPDFLNKKCELKDVLHYDPDKRIYTILSGKAYSNSTEIVSSLDMQNALNVFKRAFDYIILDTPPMSLMADAEALADQADLSVLVVRYNTIQAADINDAVDALNGSNSRLAGCILNLVKRPPKLQSGARINGYGKYKYGNYSTTEKN